jgi:undecaprenyl diphosphate synthase
MHVAIIMHGNGQWILQRGLPSPTGCTAGAAALRTVVGLAAAARVDALTLYSICSPRGDRSQHEVGADLDVLTRFLRDDLPRCLEQSVRISLIGDCEPLHWLRPALHDHNRQVSVAGSGTHLRIVVDYSAHDRIIKAAWGNDDPHAPEHFDRQLRELDPTALSAGAVDLLVRTGGGLCRSDFMLWEVAYAKLHFVDRLWPDFTARDFQRTLDLHRCAVSAELFD